MVSSRVPRRTASSTTASVSSVVPEQDTAITRSTAPTQAGSVYPWPASTGAGLEALHRAATASPAMPDPPMPASTTARGRPSAATRTASPDSALAVLAMRICAPAVATARSISDWSSAVRASASSSTDSSIALIRGRRERVSGPSGSPG
jgi:hypothetical protein